MAPVDALRGLVDGEAARGKIDRRAKARNAFELWRRIEGGEAHGRMAAHRITKDEDALDMREERIGDRRADLIVEARVVDADAGAIGAAHIQAKAEEILTLDGGGARLHIGADRASSEPVD